MEMHFFATEAVGEKNQIWNLMELINKWLVKNPDIEIKNILQTMTAHLDSVYILISIWYERKVPTAS